MKHPPSQSRKPTDANASNSDTDQNPTTVSPPTASSDPAYVGMKLMPWNEIWATVSIAKMSGNTYMVRTFYEILFREAVFDDRGAWSLTLRNFTEKKNPSSDQ
jgi:hypothetical protein